jgi:hypothetical protein
VDSVLVILLCDPEVSEDSLFIWGEGAALEIVGISANSSFKPE